MQLREPSWLRIIFETFRFVTFLLQSSNTEKNNHAPEMMVVHSNDLNNIFITKSSALINALSIERNWRAGI